MVRLVWVVVEARVMLVSSGHERESVTLVVVAFALYHEPIGPPQTSLTILPMAVQRRLC